MSGSFTSFSGKIRPGYRYILRRKIPYGLLSWRYLLPGQCSTIQAHRTIAAKGHARIPRLIWWSIQLWLWIRWVFYYAWISCYRTQKRHGSGVREQHAISPFRQYSSLIKLGILHCIPPQAYYQYQLYRPEQYNHLWEYIYDSELPTYHAWRNGFRKPGSDTLKFLGDKEYFSLATRQAGIRAAETLHYHIKGSPIPEFSKLFSQHEQLFCKPPHGNQARGSFLFTRESSGKYQIKTLDGDVFLEGKEAEVYVTRHLENNDYLIQPYYEHHPALQSLCDIPEQAITLRLITERKNNDTRYLCAYLEIPRMSPDTTGIPINMIAVLPIRLTDGLILPFPSNMVPFRLQATYETIHVIAKGSTLPFWKEACAIASKAHAEVPDIYALAWDFIITSDGPVLLEGNINWRVSVPQLILGGLLSDLAIPESQV